MGFLESRALTVGLWCLALGLALLASLLCCASSAVRAFRN
jgi:hypothetical protein